MTQNRLDFKRLGEQGRKVLDGIGIKFRESARGLQLLQVIRRLL